MPTVPNQRVVKIHRDMPGEKEGSARFGNIRTNQDGLRFRIVVLVCDCHEFACAYSCIKHEQHNIIVPKFGKIVLIQSLEKGLDVLISAGWTFPSSRTFFSSSFSKGL